MGATPQTTVLVSMYKTLYKLCVGPLVVPYVVHVAFRVTVSVASEQQQEQIEMLPMWCGLWANAPLISGQTWCDRKVLHYFSPLLKSCHWLLHWFSTFQAAIGSSSFKESWKCRHKIALQGSSVMFRHLVVIFIWFSRDRPRPCDELSDDRTSEKLWLLRRQTQKSSQTTTACLIFVGFTSSTCDTGVPSMRHKLGIKGQKHDPKSICSSTSISECLYWFIASCAWMLRGADLVYMAWGD